MTFHNTWNDHFSKGADTMTYMKRSESSPYNSILMLNLIMNRNIKSPVQLQMIHLQIIHPVAVPHWHTRSITFVAGIKLVMFYQHLPCAHTKVTNTSVQRKERRYGLDVAIWSEFIWQNLGHTELYPSLSSKQVPLTSPSKVSGDQRQACLRGVGIWSLECPSPRESPAFSFYSFFNLFISTYSLPFSLRTTKGTTITTSWTVVSVSKLQMMISTSEW